MTRAGLTTLSLSCVLFALCACPREARAFDTEPAPPSGDVRQPMYQPTLGWLAAQLLPSPEIAGGSQGAAWGLKWQLTPVAYSWGVYRKISPWRFGVVDPAARQSGSVELYVAPEYVYFPSHSASPGWKGDELFLRHGSRAYFPLLERGEFLSTSLGASVYDFGGSWAVAYEAGLYGIGGLFGVQVNVTPASGPLRVVSTAVLRFF
jgi:hypothetical protein